MKLLIVLFLCLCGLCPGKPLPVTVTCTKSHVHLFKDTHGTPTQKFTVELLLELHGKGTLFTSYGAYLGIDLIEPAPATLNIIDSKGNDLHFDSERFNTMPAIALDLFQQIICHGKDTKKILCTIGDLTVPAPEADNIRIKGTIHILYSPERRRLLSDKAITPTRTPQTFGMVIPGSWKQEDGITSPTQDVVLQGKAYLALHPADKDHPERQGLSRLHVEIRYPKGFFPEKVLPCNEKGTSIYQALNNAGFHVEPFKGTMEQVDTFLRKDTFLRYEGIDEKTSRFRPPPPSPSGWNNTPVRFAVQYGEPPIQAAVPIDMTVPLTRDAPEK